MLYLRHSSQSRLHDVGHALYQMLWCQLLSVLLGQLFQNCYVSSYTTPYTRLSASLTLVTIQPRCFVGPCTAGPNLPFYPQLLQGTDKPNISNAFDSQQPDPAYVITGIEPNPAMWEYAHTSARQAGMMQQQLQLVAADAQELPYESNMFDAAVVTLVSTLGICSQGVLPQIEYYAADGAEDFAKVAASTVAPELLDPCQR